jgi:hypothetical protein
MKHNQLKVSLILDLQQMRYTNRTKQPIGIILQSIGTSQMLKKSYKLVQI